MKTSDLNPTSLLRSLTKQAQADDATETSSMPDSHKEFTIDELAREGGSTVRNVRAYQDRGILPPPEKRGRTGIYTDVHLARLKIIGALLERGYTLNNIRDLLNAWEEGRDLNDLLGLEVAVTTWQKPNVPTYQDYQNLIDDFGDDITPEVMTKAVTLGYIIPEGMRLRIPYPRVYNAGKELSEAGVPLDAVLTQVSLVREEVDKLAERFINVIIHHLVDEKYGDDALPEGEDVPKLAEFITRIRPLADAVVSDELGRVLEKSINKILVDRLANVLAHIEENK